MNFFVENFDVISSATVLFLKFWKINGVSLEMIFIVCSC